MEKQLTIRVPPSLREEVKRAAEAQGISVDQFCAMAIARAVGEWQGRRFFARRSAGLPPDDARRHLADLLPRVKE